MKQILEVDGLQIQFNNRRVLSDIYLNIETGKVTGLLGRNGQGKSCLLQAIHGSLYSEGSVRINQQSVRQPGNRFSMIKYLPQFHFIPGSLTINRILRDHALNQAEFIDFFPDYSQKLNTPVRYLSGGERRLIELYIVLKIRATFVLLDEPFTLLSPLQIEQAQKLILQEKTHKGVLITDHLYQYITNSCEQLYFLSGGKIHMVNSTEEIEQWGYISK